MSIASRPAKCAMRITICAMQPSRLGQYRCAPFSTSAAPHTGHTVGFSMSRSPGSYSSTRPMISGITSFDRRSHTRAPTRTRFLKMSP